MKVYIRGICINKLGKQSIGCLKRFNFKYDAIKTPPKDTHWFYHDSRSSYASI